MPIPTTAEYARSLDEQDDLAAFRDRFVVDDPDLIYLDGNSLGRLPRETQDQLRMLVDETWGKRLIRGWNEGWFEAPMRIGDKIAGLVGARAGEVVVADSTSVNLYKLVMASLAARPGRHKIVTDDLNFPSDLYILQGACSLMGDAYQVEVVESSDGIHGPMDALAEAIDEDTAVVTLSHTAFKSGFVYDMTAVTRMAHAVGALVVWDLSHSAGSVIVQLNEADADMAVGCTYKYLNGGPGSPAFLYIRADLQSTVKNPVSGWMGQRDAFNFDLNYRPAGGIRHFLTGTAPTISLCAIEPGVDMLLEAGMERLRAKSVRQSEYFIGLWEAILEPLGFRLNSPRDVDRRGSHVSLGHDDGLRIDLALIEEMKVLPDFRYPDNIRLGITPLYTTYVELHSAVERMRTVVAEGIHERFSAEGVVVT